MVKVVNEEHINQLLKAMGLPDNFLDPSSLDHIKDVNIGTLCYDYGDSMSYEAMFEEVKEITERMLKHETISPYEAMKASKLFLEFAVAGGLNDT